MPDSLDDEPVNLLMARLNLKHRPDDAFPRSVFDGDSPAPIGRVSHPWGTCLKFVCKRHPDCQLLLNQQWFDGNDRTHTQRLKIGYRFLGMAPFATRAEHEAESKRVSLACRTAAAARAASS